ncbi:MAG: helix-turn-helix transcriptional regulator [Candidatus Rokubacteria bacterium]|nr:helix-turn-helix transcriptional regulator [Candidatus Rokubacteria bacterium]
MPMTWRDLGQRVKELRERRGMTQADLAARAELSRIYIQKTELGERMPHLKTLEAIARALHAELRVELVERRPRRKGGPR